MEVDTRKTSTHWQNPSISKLLAIIASGVFGFFNRIFLPNMLFDSNLFSPTRGDIHFLFLCLHCTDVWKSGIVQRWSGAGLGGLACAAALGKAKTSWQRNPCIAELQDNIGKSAYCTTLHLRKCSLS